MLPTDCDKFPRRLGSYVVVQLLGEGGMGSVYLALMGTKDLARFCVIKQLGSTWADFDREHLPEIRQRFQREAELTMELDHPGIPKTFAVHTGELPYLVQEFVDGLSLDSVTSWMTSIGEAFPVPLASHIVVEAGRALDYLHGFQARGLVHRDISPGNVMLASTGEVKLIDFGMAKATAKALDNSSQRGQIGKAKWLAPEALRGGKFDRRSDLYSLGLLYWHLLTGKDPDSSQARRAGATDTLASPSTANPDVPSELDYIVAKATYADPELRFQSAEEFALAVVAHVPHGFAGKREVSKLVFRHASRTGDSSLPRLLDDGRGLLDDALGGGTPGARPLAPSKSSDGSAPVVAPMVEPNRPAPERPTGGAKFDAAPKSPVANTPPPRDPSPRPTRRTHRIRLRYRRRSLLPFIGVGALVGVLALVVIQKSRDFFDSRLGSPEAPPALSAAQAVPRPQAVAEQATAIPPQTLPQQLPRQASETHNHAIPRAEQWTQPGGTARHAASTNPVGDPTSAARQQNADELLTMARERFERSDLASALVLARRAALQGAGAPAYVLIASCLSIKKDYAGARSALKQALRIEPKDPEAMRLMDRLRDIE